MHYRHTNALALHTMRDNKTTARVQRGLWKLFLDTTFQTRLNRICSAQVVGGWYFAIAHNRHWGKVFHNPVRASSGDTFRGNQRY